MLSEDFRVLGVGSIYVIVCVCRKVNSLMVTMSRWQEECSWSARVSGRLTFGQLHFSVCPSPEWNKNPSFPSSTNRNRYSVDRLDDVTHNVTSLHLNNNEPTGQEDRDQNERIIIDNNRTTSNKSDRKYESQQLLPGLVDCNSLIGVIIGLPNASQPPEWIGICCKASPGILFFFASWYKQSTESDGRWATG